MTKIDDVYPSRSRAKALAVIVPRIRTLYERLGAPPPGKFRSYSFGNRFRVAWMPPTAPDKAYVRVDDAEKDQLVFSAWINRDGGSHVMTWKRGDWERALLVSRSSER